MATEIVSFPIKNCYFPWLSWIAIGSRPPLLWSTKKSLHQPWFHLGMFYRGWRWVYWPWSGATHEGSEVQEDTSSAKTDVTSKSPVGDISVITLIRTNTTQMPWFSKCQGLGWKRSLRGLGIWVIQDILRELRNVDGGHHGEPPSMACWLALRGWYQRKLEGLNIQTLRPEDDDWTLPVYHQYSPKPKKS